LFGLFSLVTLLAFQGAEHHRLPVRETAWYTKDGATFADTIAFVRRTIWERLNYTNSAPTADSVLIPQQSLDLLMDTLCYGA
jgi:hypothetical protein